MATQTVTSLTTGNMLNYVWLSNLEGADATKIKSYKPHGMACYADPSSEHCRVSTFKGVSGIGFSCTKDKTCYVTVTGTDLDHTNDRLRIANAAAPINGDPCAAQHPGVGTGQFTAFAGPGSEKKIFAVGTYTSNALADAAVCYCHYKAHAQGCGDTLLGNFLPPGESPGYSRIGTLTIST